ncbi:quinone oxidoreductase [Arthrobacter sp. Hiyo6]|nr:quinone oxidoreductase [Arthrobacter sp. Hiyo6]
MTHAIVARQPGGPEVLQLAEVDRPVPGPGQVLMKVTATGVNFIDTYQRSGTYKVSYPFTPGSEAAGTVEEVGEGVTTLAPGDRIATAEGSRCYAATPLLTRRRPCLFRTAWTISRPPRCRCRASRRIT